MIYVSGDVSILLVECISTILLIILGGNAGTGLLYIYEKAFRRLYFNKKRELDVIVHLLNLIEQAKMESDN